MFCEFCLWCVLFVWGVFLLLGVVMVGEFLGCVCDCVVCGWCVCVGC